MIIKYLLMKVKKILKLLQINKKQNKDFNKIL